MNGVLVIDKPPGVTSHDVVAVARRALRERRVGHTGTLDPMATGILPLVCGQATRLARFLTAADKDYDADIRFGITTDSDDLTGTELARSTLRPAREDVVRALASLSGSYLQAPPAYSAKKVAGRRAYALARGDEAVALAPVPVTVTRAELTAFTGDSATVSLTCSAGFYVRSLARDLGERVGTGAALAALRRTRSGAFRLDGAVTMDALLQEPDAVLRRVVPMRHLLSAWPSAVLTDEGRQRVAHGREVEPQHLRALGAGSPDTAGTSAEWVRLVDGTGELLALATAGVRPGSLHPAVVLI